ncbi:MAG: hypothetical protein OXU20_01275 [Myxococcales bacterium]|nr:hypothetical protein [Myxococcales bacterium]MDD9971078.1 hypothetical protein [Myxococcales bacterium]
MQVDRQERARRLRLVEAHMAAENAHDLDAIVATFSPQSMNSVNLTEVPGDPAVVRQAHIDFGFGPTPGALEGTQVLPEREHYTDGAIVIEGFVQGRHVGEFGGLPPSNEIISLPYVAFYVFGEDDLLASERVVLDTSRFGQVLLAQLPQGRM